MFRKKILKKLNQIDQIPTLLSVAIEIDRLTKRSDTPINKIGELIKNDPSLTSRIMKVGNSAVYASVNEITDIDTLIMRLGLQEIRTITITVAILNSFKQQNINYQDFWIHSITAAYLAKHLDFKAQKKASGIYTSALLHDIGVVILDQYFPKIYKKIFEIAKKNKSNLLFVEDKVLGINHAEIGELVLKNWKLPEEIVSCVQYHHEPQYAPEEYRYHAQLIYIANFICNNQGIHNGTQYFPHRFYDDIWEELEISVDDIPNILEEVQKETNLAKEILKIGS